MLLPWGEMRISFFGKLHLFPRILSWQPGWDSMCGIKLPCFCKPHSPQSSVFASLLVLFWSRHGTFPNNLRYLEILTVLTAPHDACTHDMLCLLPRMSPSFHSKLWRRVWELSPRNPLHAILIKSYWPELYWLALSSSCKHQQEDLLGPYML